MPAIVVMLTETSKPRIISIHEVMYAAKQSLLNRIGNPLCYYSVQEISGELYEQLCETIPLPNYPKAQEDLA